MSSASVAFIKKDGVMRVFYKKSRDYLQMSGDFDYFEFCNLYNECKGRFSLSEHGKVYRNGDKALSFKEFAKNLNCPILEYVMKKFKFSPCICRVALKKKNGAKVVLIKKVKNSRSGGYREAKLSDTELFLMNDCVRKAVEAHDMRFFYEYLEIYRDGGKRNASEDKIYRQFAKKVNNFR